MDQLLAEETNERGIGKEDVFGTHNLIMDTFNINAYSEKKQYYSLSF